MDRREALKLGVVAAGAAALSGCNRLIAKHARSAPALDPALPKDDAWESRRVLSRLSFGWRPGEIARVSKIGREAYVEEQLAADFPEEPRLTLLLHRIDVLNIDSAELRDLPRKEAVRQLQQAALLRAVYGRNQLQERMADLWTNHFNVYALKADGAYLKSADDLKVVREHALGKFPDMLRKSAQSPAMLAYLDNTVNRSGVANENYARELLELHTLGVHGGYTQKDVQEVARCFTGWTVEKRFLKPRDRFRFVPELHDNGRKRVLGVDIPAGGGEKDGERVLDILVSHPSTAKFIAGKLCREFLGDAESPWRDHLAGVYLQTGGDIREMLRPLLLSDDLLTGPPIVKRPLDYAASALRAVDASTDCDRPVLKHLERMGQAPLLWPMPDGFPTEPSAWSGSLLGRWNFALDLCQGRLQGTEVASVEGLSPAELILGRRLEPTEAMAAATRGVAGTEAVALCMSSPEFQWR